MYLTNVVDAQIVDVWMIIYTELSEILPGLKCHWSGFLLIPVVYPSFGQKIYTIFNNLHLWYPPLIMWDSAMPSWHHKVCNHSRCVLLQHVFHEEVDLSQGLLNVTHVTIGHRFGPNVVIDGCPPQCLCTWWQLPQTSDAVNCIWFAGCLCVGKLSTHHWRLEMS